MPRISQILSAISLRRPLALGIQIVVLGAVLAGSLAFVTFNKTVTLSVDGNSQHVRTFAGSVRGALASAGVRVGDHDSVTPGPDSKLADHEKIAVRRGRLLHLRINGQNHQVWSTATTVGGALAQLDVAGGPATWVSAPRSQRIGLTGATFAVRMPQQVRIKVDGGVRYISTTARTVAQVLARRDVTLTPHDVLSVSKSQYPTTGLLIRVTRVSKKRVVRSTVVAHSVRRVADSSLYRGNSQVVDSGQDGVVRKVFAVTFVNGRVASRALAARKVAVPPQPAVVHYGTKPVPVAPARVSSASVGSSGGLNWGALAACESGGNPRAVSPSGKYRGLYQFSLSTWHGVGGSGDPINASSGEQTHRAEILYSSSGRGAWPVCGANL